MRRVLQRNARARHQKKKGRVMEKREGEMLFLVVGSS